MCEAAKFATLGSLKIHHFVKGTLESKIYESSTADAARWKAATTTEESKKLGYVCCVILV